MDPKIYNEFNLVFEDGEIVSKTPTKRKTVSIHEVQADYLNSTSKQTGLYYELAKKQEKSEARKQADELGIKYGHNISDSKLQEKIDKYLSQ